MSVSKRFRKPMLTVSAAAALSIGSNAIAADSELFEPTMKSLQENFQIPEWYKDAKFGIFAHWGPQCQPEAGDWYAREMYIDGNWKSNFHKEKYGDPKTFGFKDIIQEWHADKWDPDYLVGVFKMMGAKFLVSLANHHDNFDLWDSKYQEWNSMDIGPKRDIAGEWKKACEKAGLHWGASVHASHAWCWYETSRPYDGLLTKADGKGTWWGKLGLDPQELYAQKHEASPDNRHWDWDPKRVVTPDKEYRDKFMKRHKQLIDDYHPEILYYDDTVVPFYPTLNDGVELTAYYYNQSLKYHNGKQEVLATGKILKGDQTKALVWDVERGVPGDIVTPYWQTDTCLGNWHYERSVYNRNGYKSASTVISMLINIVSKGGNLLLSVPIRGNGTIDEKELAVCQEIGAWMKINGEGIYGTRLWKKYGEGPQADGPQARLNNQGFNEGQGKAATAQDFRFTSKGDTVYAFTLMVPETNTAMTLKSFADKKVKSVKLLGANAAPQWKQNEDGTLEIVSPDKKDFKIALCYKIEF